MTAEVEARDTRDQTVNMKAVPLAILLLTCTCALFGCAPRRPGIDSGPDGTLSGSAHAEVVGAAEALFAAMRARDTTALRGMFAPEVRIVSVRVEGASVGQVQSRAVSDFITSIGRGGEELVERMWDPRVEVAGDFASLWAPYDFHIGRRFSHCGHDAFHFLRTRGRWTIVGLTYTVQPSPCAAPPTSGAPAAGTPPT